MASNTFAATLAKLPTILAWIRFQLDQTTLPKPEKMRLEIAMEEAIVNIIHHAKPEELDLTTRHIPGRQIEFDLSDAGPPFNPLTHPFPEDQDVPLKEQTPGGKGLLLMRKCVDSLLYRRENGHNILTLIKKLPLDED